MFRFRTLRKWWMVVIAVVSLVCIALSLSLYEYYEPKSDLGVLVAVPGLCLTASTIAVLAKPLFRSSTIFPTSVAVECIWTACFVILSLILSLFSLGVGMDIKGTDAPVPFLVVEICCWSLTGLTAIYSSLVLFLSIFTAVTVDNDVWFRDITGSPSPFPVAICLYTTRLWLASIRGTASRMGNGTSAEHLPHCLPQCSCREKIPPPSPPTALPPLGILSDRRLDGWESVSSIVPGVRIPTALERHNSIFVGLDGATPPSVFA